jgi:uncharacterized membrane protein YdfJ with MMPL/SSD domain
VTVKPIPILTKVIRPNRVGNGVILFVISVLLAITYGSPFTGTLPFLSAGGILLVAAMVLNQLS